MSLQLNFLTTHLTVLAAHALRMLLNLSVIKLISIYTGPAGFGQLGNFMSIITLTSVISGGGINTAVIKYTAEYKKDRASLNSFLNTALIYGFISSVIYGLVLLSLSEKLARKFFNSIDLEWLIFALVLAQFFAFIGGFITSVATGLGEQVKINLLAIVGCICSFPLVVWLIKDYKMVGAALALMLVISIPGITNVIAVIKQSHVKLNFINFSLKEFKKIHSYTLMLIVSAAVFPATEFLLRDNLIENIGLFLTGHWQALNKLSSAYIGFFAIVLSSIYMPKLASLNDKKQIIKILRVTQIYIATTFIVISILIYMFKAFVIELLFSKDFLDISKYLVWQFMGDFFRISTYVIGFLFVAKKMTVLYITLEILQCFLVYFIFVLFNNAFGFSVESTAKAYFGAYLINFLIVYGWFLYIKKEAAIDFYNQ